MSATETGVRDGTSNLGWLPGVLQRWSAHQGVGPEIVTEIVDAYCLTIATDAGNCYSNGDLTVVRLREGVSDY